jgi:hypothetical protein
MIIVVDIRFGLYRGSSLGEPAPPDERPPPGTPITPFGDEVVLPRRRGDAADDMVECVGIVDCLTIMPPLLLPSGSGSTVEMELHTDSEFCVARQGVTQKNVTKALASPTVMVLKRPLRPFAIR